MTGYEYEPKQNSIFLTLKNRDDQVKIRLVSIPVHFTDEYQGKSFENFAWKVIDRTTGEVKAFKANGSVYGKIKKLAEDEAWGDPQTYDLTISRPEEKGDDYFKVEPSKEKSSITDVEKEMIVNTNCDLRKLFKIENDKGTSTFGGGDEQPPLTDESAQEEINLDDIPF